MRPTLLRSKVRRAAAPRERDADPELVAGAAGSDRLDGQEQRFIPNFLLDPTLSRFLTNCTQHANARCGLIHPPAVGIPP